MGKTCAGMVVQGYWIRVFGPFYLSFYFYFKKTTLMSTQ